MLKGKNIQLRAVEPGDLDIHFAWENDAQYWSVSNTVIPFSRDTLKQYLSSIKDIFSDRQFRFMIETTDRKAIGFIDLFEFDPLHKRAGVGILIGDVQERRKGYAKEALDLLIDYATKKLQLRNLYCNILSQNTGSIHLFESRKFVQQGKKPSWHWNGEQYEDELFFQLQLTW